jgi:hypothetical protein
VAASYADHADVIQAILGDVEIQGTVADAATFGDFELSVSEE